jgi:hypothetical protein
MVTIYTTCSNTLKLCFVAVTWCVSSEVRTVQSKLRIPKVKFRIVGSLGLWVPAHKRILNSDIQNDAGRWYLRSCSFTCVWQACLNTCVDGESWSDIFSRSEVPRHEVYLTLADRIMSSDPCLRAPADRRAIQSFLLEHSPILDLTVLSGKSRILLWLGTHAFRDLFIPNFSEIATFRAFLTYTLKMEALCASYTLVRTYQTTRSRESSQL